MHKMWIAAAIVVATSTAASAQGSGTTPTTPATPGPATPGPATPPVEGTPPATGEATPAPSAPTATASEPAQAGSPEPVPAPEGAPAPAAEPAKPDLPFKIYGKTYIDASYLRNTGAGTPPKSRGVDVKRFYLGIDYTLNKMISATFLTDIGDKNGKYDVFVKKAYVQAKLAPELVLRAGVGDNPWIPFAEDRYGYRYVENTLIDRTKFGNSADWGVHALGRVAKDVIGYQVSIVNGNGYANPTRAKWPTIEARVDAKLVEHLSLAVGTSISTLGATTNATHTGMRFNGLAAWTDKQFRVGVEGFLGKNYTADQVTGKVPENTARGVSVFGNYRFLPKVGAFGRIDYVQPVADTDTDISDTYLNVGIDYEPFKFLNLALVYKRDVVDTGMAGFVFSTSNGNIGSMTVGESGKYQELGVFAQLVF